MMGESCVCLGSKKSKFLVHLDPFSKFLKYFKFFEKGSKWTKNSNFFASEPIFWANLDYSRIRIDHMADSLLKLQIKIGVDLINVELSQLLTLYLTQRLPSITKIACGKDSTKTYKNTLWGFKKRIICYTGYLATILLEARPTGNTKLS